MEETFYTKEMYERGETVGSGMTAIYKDKEVLIRLGCDTLRNVVFRLDGEWVTVNVDDIKPIDTRTDREKAKEYFEKELKESKVFVGYKQGELICLVATKDSPLFEKVKGARSEFSHIKGVATTGDKL